MKKLALVLGICLLSGFFPTNTRASQISYSDVYTVGDSLVDPGNLYPLLGIPPSPPYYQGRFSNGPVWAELLPAKLGLTYNPSHNFAYGGSGAGDFHPSGLPLGARQQVTSLIGTDDVVDPNALYIISTGSNDYVTDIDIPSTVNNIVESVNRLSDAGAKNFLVAGVPDFAKIPSNKDFSQSELDELSLLSTTHNSLLELSLNQVSTVRNLDIDFLDLQSTFEQISSHPKAYGLDNISDACLDVTIPEFPDPLPEPCQNPDRYFFWDNSHPTRRGHQLITEAALVSLGYQNRIKSVPESSSVFGILASAGIGYLLLKKKTEQ